VAKRIDSRFGRHAPVKTPATLHQMKTQIGNCQMSVRESSSPEKRSTISLKAALMTAIIVVFGILHLVGAMWLHGAASPRPIDTSEVMTNRD
jgi:hypothetical protein